MPPQDALEAIFEQIAEIYAKLCESIDVLLSISTSNQLLSDNGNFLIQSVTFNNLDTEPNGDIQAIIAKQVTDFNAFLTQLVTAKRATLPLAQRGNSDCKILRICDRKNTINGIWTGVQNVAATPAQTTSNLAEAIAQIKAEFDKQVVLIELLSISSDNELLSEEGLFLSQTFTFKNFDTTPNEDIENIIKAQILDFLEFINQLIATKRNQLPFDQQFDSDCKILAICDKTITINALWLQFQNAARKPNEISVSVASAIVEIKKLFDVIPEDISDIEFVAPVLWTDKGRLNVDPNSYPFAFDNPDNDPEITAISANVNDVLGGLIQALNIALGGETDPV